MPQLELRFDTYGRPVVAVEVKPGLQYHPQLYAHPPNIVPARVVDFLVDTGAHRTTIDEGVIAPFRLLRLDPVMVLSADSGAPEVVGYRFPLSLRLHEAGQQEHWYHGTWQVAAEPAGSFRGCDFQGVIGMDMLSLGALNYTSWDGQFVLSWASGSRP